MADWLEASPTLLKRILLVEDDPFLGSQIERRLKTEEDFVCEWVKSLAAAQTRLAAEPDDFFAAILDFNLPDARQGEIIPEILGRGIPTLVFTASSDAAVREKVWSYNVVDYIFKDDPQSISYLIQTIRRLEKNRSTKVMVVDDSSFFRKVLQDLLHTHLFRVMAVGNGESALALLEDHPDVRLLLTDYEMPGLNGLELTRQIRRHFSRDELAIIGISAAGDQVMAASFIKSGANDFIIKQSFLTEEFYSRVNSCLENVERAQTILALSIRDYLTGLHNRRYLFEAGRQMLARTRRRESGLACAMLDIDFFKRVNDTYGHDSGDRVLRELGKILRDEFREGDICARFGGEEFCVLVGECLATEAEEIFERLRVRIAGHRFVTTTGQNIPVTVSIGVCLEAAPGRELEAILKIADTALYEAKNSGRNRVVCQAAAP